MSDTCISRAEKEENVESQREELEALEAIYGDDFEVLVSAGDATNERNMCGRFPEVSPVLPPDSIWYSLDTNAS